MADIAEIGFKANTGELVDAEQKLKKLPPAAEKAERASQRLSKILKETGDNASGAASRLLKGTAANDNLAGSAVRAAQKLGILKAALSGVGGLLSGIAAGLSVGAYVKLADTWSDLSARVGLASGNMENSAAVMNRLSDMARRTYSSLQNTAEAYTGTADSLRELGLNTTQTLDYVEALNNALVVSGAKGQRAESAMNALNKAMAIGKLQGDGLETVMANSGRVAAALAKELGITQNQLRKFASEGKITSGVIYRALTKELETLREEADSMPATIGDAFVIVGNSVLQLVGTFDKFTGISANVSAAIIAIGDGIKSLADNLPELVAYAKQAGAVLAIVFAPAILSGVLALTAGVVQLSIALSVGLVRAAGLAAAALFTLAMSNPLSAILYSISLAVAAVYTFRDSINNVVGTDIVGTVKTGANVIIGSFVGAFNGIVTVWKQLPGAIGDVVYGAVNNTLNAINEMVYKAAASIQDFINKIVRNLNSLDEFFGVTPILKQVDFVSNLKVADFKNPYAGQASAVGKSIGDEMTKAVNVDYLGSVGEAITGVTEKLTVATEAAGKLNEQLDPSKKKKKGGKTDTEKFSDIINGAERSIASMQAEYNAIGMSELATAKLKYETDLLNEAKQKNIKLSEGQRNQLIAVAHGMAELEIQTKKAKDTLEFSKEITKGFFSDLRSGIEQGKSLWESFGNAALNVLNKLVDKLLNDVLDALFEVNKAGSGGGGGWLGGILGAIGGLFSAKGNAFGGGKLMAFANGGAFTNSVVNRPTAFDVGVMGEAGPEAIMPLKRGPGGSLGVEMYGGGGKSGDVNVNFAPQYNIEAGATQEAFEELRKAREEDRKNFNNDVAKAVANVRKRSNGGLG